MSPFHHLLVPVDGSLPAAAALTKAAALASSCNAALTLFHAVDMNQELSAFEQVSTGGYVPSEFLEKGYAILADMERRFVPPALPRTRTVQIGNPGQAIITYAAGHDIDLIVMGNRGFSRLKQLFLGSVSQYVLLHSSIPVLIVKN